MAKEDQENQNEEKQVPAKPKKASSSLSLPVLIGIIVGIVVFQAVVIFLLFKMFIQQPQAAEEPKKQGEEKVEKKEESSEHPKQEFESDPKLTKMFETGRIMTNPKGSPSKFVIVDLAIIYRMVNEQAMEEILKELTELGEGGGGGHGGSQTFISKKQQTRIKGIISMLLGSFTIDELQSRRDSLSFLIKKDLEPILNDAGGRMKVTEVIIQEFIIQ